MLQSLTAAVTGRTEPNEQNGRDGFTFRVLTSNETDGFTSRVAHVKRNGFSFERYKPERFQTKIRERTVRGAAPVAILFCFRAP